MFLLRTVLYLLCCIFLIVESRNYVAFDFFFFFSLPVVFSFFVVPKNKLS